jgi:hydroxymethylglutaryl-CoA reductase
MREDLLTHVSPYLENMEKRGGGVRKIELSDKSSELADYFQLNLKFNTCDSMGANFINTILEECLKRLKWLFANRSVLKNEPQPEFLMAILSNYTPNCLVRAWVEHPIENLTAKSSGLTTTQFADRFEKAVKIACLDKYRAVTHNKGIFNGIDAVVLATGNDFRAVEACGHAYASRNGSYRSLTDCSLEGGNFKFTLEIPLAIGTVGGLTCLHPLAQNRSKC